MDAVSLIFLIAVLTCVYSVFWSLKFIARAFISTFSTPKSSHDERERRPS